jgi:NADH-quinone oxidoreductase subunit N
VGVVSQLQSVDAAALAPVLVAGLGAVAVLLADLVLPPVRRAVPVLLVAVAAAAGTLVAALALVGDRRSTFCTPAATLPGGVRVGQSCSWTVDGFTLFFLVLLPAAALGVLLLSICYVQDWEVPPGEYGFLMLSSLTGALTMAGARDLITLLVGLETLTLPTYALVGLRRRSRPGAEAAVKYLLISVTATAVTLLGIAFIYGLTGTVYFDRIAATFAARSDVRGLPLAAGAVALVLAGFGFKMAAVPFHWWAPDVYQGAPVPVAAYLATVSKSGGVAGLLLVTVGAFRAFRTEWGWVLTVLAIASMTVGNLVALRQRQAVRLLAWSSVAHAGYLLVPLGALATDADGGAVRTAVGATLGYLALYVAVNLGAFGCVTAVARQVPGNLIEGYRGLAARSPVLAAALAFFLLGLAGLPPTLAGLVAKVVVVRAALLGGAGWLAVAVAVNTVVGLAYYLRLAALPFRPAVEAAVPELVPDPPGRLRLAPSLVVALAAVAVVTLVLGVVPQIVLGAASVPP